jgi:FtsP/CotA-like multicopper oxidase with cupredoxin domain
MSDGEVVRHEYTVTMTSFMQQILPPSMNLLTPVWGYGGVAKDAVTGTPLGYVRSTPAPSFEAVRGIPIQVKWQNNISTPHIFPVDPTIHWANPNNYPMPMAPFPTYSPGFPEAQSPVPLVTHLHGSETQSYYDGVPEQWFTYNGLHGPDYSTLEKTDPNAAVYYYPNAQPAATLWYHDHALGVTRINVMAGLAGFYLLRDPNSTNDYVAPLLPAGKYEMPLMIQDRTFYADGSLWFPTVGINPSVYPYWFDAFLGNTIIVNGKVWPNMNVDKGQYRFRILDASNARIYRLSFLNTQTNTTIPFIQIGSDGGYLKAPATVTELFIGPAERVDLLVDFSGLAPGTKILLKNSALTGEPTEEQTIGQIMQFTVTTNDGFKPKTLPTLLNPTLAGPTFPNLPPPTKQRILTLFQVNGQSGPLIFLLNGQKWHGEVSELPKVGSTEEWIFVELTRNAHPIHLHLIQFQIVSRQDINATMYTTDWITLQRQLLGDYAATPPWPTNFIPKELPIEPYLLGTPTPPPPNEQCWKDTVLTLPFTATVIRVRFASQDGSPFPFDETQGPGYVWHCHILDHEDNEMMRPYKVTSASPEFPNTLIIYIPSIIIAISLIIITILFLFLQRKRRKRKKANAEYSN